MLVSVSVSEPYSEGGGILSLGDIEGETAGVVVAAASVASASFETKFTCDLLSTFVVRVVADGKKND